MIHNNTLKSFLLHEISMDIEKEVNELWAKKYGCAECVFLVLSNELNFELDPQILKMAKIMGSGYYSGCICGSLAASISFCAIYKEPNPKLAKTLHDKFVKEFGATSCREISTYPNCQAKPIFAIKSALEELRK